MHNCAIALVNAAMEHNVCLATAESCTGGMVAAALTSVIGASRCFVGSVVAYDNTVKESALGVSRATLEQYGAVSEETAAAMCDGVLGRLPATAALSVTGIAGPDGGTADKPVGTVCFGFRLKGATMTLQTRRFAGDRQAIREAATEHALRAFTQIIKQA